MKKSFFVFLLAGLVCLLGVVTTSSATALTPPLIKAVYLNQSFTLPKGESANLGDYSVTIFFKNIVSVCVDPPMEGSQPGVRYGCYPDVAQLLLGSPLSLPNPDSSTNLNNNSSITFENLTISLTDLDEDSGTFLITDQRHNIGTNIKTPDGTIWVITTLKGNPGDAPESVIRRAFTSAGAFLSYGFNNWGSVIEANSADLTLDVGSFVPPSDGRVLCSDRGADKGTCYLMTGGKKAGFTSEAVFRGLGFSFSQALWGDVSFMASTSNIDNTQEAHRPGVLVNNNGRIDLIIADGVAGIPSMQVFNSWGFSFQNVIPANNADKALVLRSVVPERQPGSLFP